MRYSHHTLKARLLLLSLLFVTNQKIYADTTLDSLLHILKTAAHDTIKIKTLSALAEVCDLKDMLPYCLENKVLCEKAIAAKRTPTYFYKNNLAGSINNLGYYYSKIGDPNKALLCYKESLKIFEEINDIKSAAYELNNIAYIYDNQGDVSKALEYFYKNLKLQEEIKDTLGIAYTLNNIGYIFFNQKKNAKAMDYYSKSMKLFEPLNAKKGIAMTNNNIGLIYSSESKLDKALQYYNKSLSIYEGINDQYNVTFSLSSIGNVYYKLGNYDKALEYLNRSLVIAEDLEIKEQISYTLTSISRILLIDGNTNKAQEYASRAFKISNEVGDIKSIQNVANALKSIYTKQGKYRDAFDMYALEMQMRDSIINETNRKDASTKDLQYQYEKKELQIKLENERKIAKKNLLIFISLFVAFVIIALSVFYTRQNNFKIRLQRMELEQQQYRAQMNPHFIFNCLNSIQHYIVHNDVISANKYLSEFASLMRKTLENNQLQAIDLQHEIDYLNSYLTLEQMRFENKFTYEINYDKNVNVSDTQILPMIIQPFAENAIVHGLCYLEKDGKLSVTFEKQNDYLICKIEDNGIGRAASQAIKKQSSKAHTSQGVEMIQKRLELVSIITKRKFDVEIIDKKDDNGKATGTLVILKFPTEI
ncbi:MAG TPA: tetratricopeptide repeat protein [Chitinophagales bacterium]|nr:tetratricopeptide repeat protein [Chitinophagales bacterium]